MFKHFCSRTNSEGGKKFCLNYMKKTVKTCLSPINDNPWSSAQAKYHRACSDIHQRRLQRLGPVGESLQFLIIQSQSVPAEYIVFFFEASLPAAACFFFVFFPPSQEPHTKHTQASHTLRHRPCASNSQPPADCEVTNEHCHQAKHLLALLLQLCTEVLPFCFSRPCVRVLKILPHSGCYSAKLPS